MDNIDNLTSKLEHVSITKQKKSRKLNNPYKNIINRSGSTRNAVCKDIVGIKLSNIWTEQDTLNKIKHFETCKTFIKHDDREICNYCGSINNTNIKYHIEHFIPSCNTTLNIYGANHDGNLFISCSDCNHKKGGKIDLNFTWILDHEVRDYFIRYHELYKHKLYADQNTVQIIKGCNKITDTCHILIAKVAEFSTRTDDLDKINDKIKLIDQLLIDITDEI
jgi:hypothetical protein